VTLTHAQIEILRQALAVVRGVPTRDHYNADWRGDPDCEAMTDAGLMLRCQTTAGARFYKVTGAGVRAICHDAKAAVYLTGEDVTVFTTRNGGYRMRWDAPDKGRFAQGMVYRVSAQAVRFKERR
jgi:hypothetical protein